MNPRPAPRASVARSMLGDGHPLVQALAEVDAATAHLVAVTAVLGAGVLGLATGRPWGAALALAAGLGVLVLAIRLVMALDTSRRRVRDVLIEGREWVPIAAVQRQRRRLLEPKRRRRLAEGLEVAGRAALRSPGEMAHVLPGATPEAVSAVGEDLQAVARALRSAEVSVRGVAIAERLVTDITSALYSCDIHDLGCELARVRWHLATAERAGPPATMAGDEAVRDATGAGASHQR